MHKFNQCENDVGSSSAGVSWLDENEIETMGEGPTAAPTFKPTIPPPVQKPTSEPVKPLPPKESPEQGKLFPTQAPPPVFLKPTQAPSKRLKPTLAPPRKLKPTQAPVEQIKPTQRPVQQKPTQSPVQQKPTQGPVQQKPTQGPVQQKPTQAPVEQIKPTQKPVQQRPTQGPVQQKPTQGPVQQKPTKAPVEQIKPTQGPVQQKPTQGPVQQIPTHGPVQQRPVQVPWRQTKPTLAPVESILPIQYPWQDHPKPELPIEYLPPVQQRPTYGPVQQRPTQAPWQQSPWQQSPWQQHPQQKWSDESCAEEDQYADLPPYSGEFDHEIDWPKPPHLQLPEQQLPEQQLPELPYYDYDLPEKYKPEHEQDQLYHPIQKPGTEPGQHWQRPCPVDLAILRDGLRWQVKAIDFYFKAAEELGEHYGNFFRTKGNEETRCFKMILNLLCDLNDNGYGKIPKQSLGGFLDWESSLPSGADYIVDGLSGSKGSGPKQKQPAARQRPYGGFFCPPGRYPRPRMINKSKARACLTGAIVMVAEATTIYEEQIKCLGHPVVRNLLIRIWMHEKEVLVELTEKLLEILPDDY